MTCDRNRICRRSVLLLGLVSLTAASASPDTTVTPIMNPLPAEPTAAPGSVKIRNVAHWTGVFEQSWDYQYRTSLPMSRSTDSWSHYDLSYSLDSCVAMFRATGALRYLDRALEYVENVAASAVVSSSLRGSQFKDDYLGWASSASGQGGDEIPLYESYFWRYATALLVAMREVPEVYGDPGYLERHDRLLRFAEEHIFDKWYSRGAGPNIYRERTHMASHWALIALNLSQITADPARRARYDQVVANVDQHVPGTRSGLRPQLRRNPVEATAYFWSDVWGSARRPGQDVSHGNGVMAYIVEARDRGRFWTGADMAAFSALLTKVIWPGATTYREFVDGTGADNGWFSDGFVKLGRFDPAVQRRLEDHRVVNDQFAANMAFNARVLGS
ncbi:hypothetical protein ACFQFC_13220 [Amorphoplanes digitatis]|uniref:Uncharacterized protein n=1 Tax=Actinoplanes digitatis TaxID=1868 RepID=A0A7W7I2C7_9ACTN|nr:hypothetical protein [Actinoplanes digitatis]MBB4765162.1 hypothetical protein [Actinoplanes digitatis]BFE74905.1 hypothetical protein GCM10020092_082060 [Actinoplanes digitatis]GID94613.1 hypothetical protein Adi01nite_40250 [Actinoplanes digitatis]